MGQILVICPFSYAQTFMKLLESELSSFIKVCVLQKKKGFSYESFSPNAVYYHEKL